MLDLNISNVFKRLTNFNRESANGCWEGIKSCLLNACVKLVDGQKVQGDVVVDDTVDNAVKLKLKLWKEWN